MASSGRQRSRGGERAQGSPYPSARCPGRTGSKQDGRRFNLSSMIATFSSGT